MTVVVTDEHALSGEVVGGAGVAHAPVGRRMDRRAHALAVLAAVEQRTGVRRARPQPAIRAEGVNVPHHLTPPEPAVAARHLPVQPALRGLLPGDTLPVGGTLAVQGSTSLLLGLLAAASKEGAWVAFVGAPAMGLVAAADAGLTLERVAVIPAPGPYAPTVVAALLDGIDVVVLGPDAALLDGDRRRLAARARERGAVLATTMPWPGAQVTLDVRGGSWWGADQGAGWLRRRAVRVLRTGRGAAARPVELEVEVPVSGSSGAVSAGAVAAASSTAEERLRVVA